MPDLTSTESPPATAPVVPAEDGWFKIGFHRPVAGFFYNYVIAIFAAVVLIITNALIIPLLLPYPDARGYYGIAQSLYALLFLLFDAGVGSAIGRFVPEYRVKDPKRALQYISFFIWFQMFTGLMQVTFIAFYVFYWMPPDMGHLTWIYLVFSTIQFPGMLSVMWNVLKAYQQFAKYILLKLIKDHVFQLTTQIVFILLGRAWGAANPQIGELIGMSVGLVLGLYINEFAAAALGAHYLNQILKKQGFSVGDCFRPNFSREVAKESLIYGLKTMPSSVYGVILGLFSFLITFSSLPAYAAWMGLMSLANNFSEQITIGGQFTDYSRYSIAESYMNDKRELTNYYIAQALKWRWFVTLLFSVFVIVLLPLALREFLDLFGSEWLQALRILPLMCIGPILQTFDPPVNLVYVNKPIPAQIIGILQSTAGFTWYLFLLYGIRMPLTIELFILKDVPIVFAFHLIQWAYIHKKVIPVRARSFIMPALVLPVVPAVLFWGVASLFATYIFPLGVALMGGIAFGIIATMAALFLMPVLVYCPLMGLFGCFDEHTLRFLEQAIPLTGPSKGLTRWMYRATRWCYNRSPLKEKFPIHGWEGAAREALELEAIKRAQDAANLQAKQG